MHKSFGLECIGCTLWLNADLQGLLTGHVMRVHFTAFPSACAVDCLSCVHDTSFVSQLLAHNNRSVKSGGSKVEFVLCCSDIAPVLKCTLVECVHTGLDCICVQIQVVIDADS